MQRKDEGPSAAGAPWTRGAFVSLWLIAFALLGGALAARWDSLLAELSGAPRIEQGAER
jgi:hypothetical protein